MKKCTPVLFAAFAAGLSLGAFPLEWNINNQTEIPYETEIDRSKLQKLAGVDQECGFEVTATTPSGKKKLDVTLFEGQKKNSVALRFTVPNGTTALDCEPAGKGTITQADASLNLFDGVLNKASAWKGNRGTKIVSKNGKICVTGLPPVPRRDTTTTVTCTVAVPAKLAGMAVKFELDFKSTAKESFPCLINVDQLDANGKVLSESLSDPRWLSLMRPVDVLTPHRESGRIHPKAKKLRLTLRANAWAHTHESYGKPVSDTSIFTPKFELSRLAVRAAEQIPFPGYRNEFFADGVSGKDGDFALDTTKGSFGKAFFFATHSQACWAEAKAITEQDEIFYPINDGTVEAWYYPEWEKLKSDSSILFTAESAPFVGPMRDSDKQNKRYPCLGLKYHPKTGKTILMFKDYTLKKYKKSFNCLIPSGKWSHVAVQWSKDSGIKVFINGKTVFEDSSFTFTPVDYTDPQILNAKFKSMKGANEFIPCQFSLGNERLIVRSNRIGVKNSHHFRGKIDLLRISSTLRYSGDFTPAKSFVMDDDTRALFNFDRSFDGKSAGGIKVISGSISADTPRQENVIEVNGRKIEYFPGKITPENDPHKVLSVKNYKNIPVRKDFISARKAEQFKFKFKGNAEKNITLDAPVIMDYIEYTNNGNETVVHPFVRLKQEIDPRSFGDIRDSLGLDKLSHRERTNRIFQFMLSSSDYFMSYQVRFNPGSDRARRVCYDALVMLNAYCGFECGPLNNMTANMLTCAGGVPAGQTGGYGHSFQQVWVDGKSNLYDLSAQMFFPSMDNETPASLGDVELEPGIHNRVGGNSNHFVRIGTRRYVAQDPAFQERVAMSLRPGESLRMWYANEGKFNSLQTNDIRRYNFLKKPYARDVSQKVHATFGKIKDPVVEVDHYFPEFGNAYLKFDASPAKYAKNFTHVKSGSFCYNVTTCYPVVFAEYSAKLKNGSFAKLEISTDRGATFRPLPLDKDGVARPFYAVCARSEYLIRVKAPMKSVAKFSANTHMMTNTRVMTCKLQKGANDLLCSNANNSEVDVTIQYRKHAKNIEIKNAVYSGAAVGFERITTVLKPGETKKLPVSGVSADAKVETTGKLKASLENGMLVITAPGNCKSIEAATIIDNGARQQLMVIIHPGVEMVLADGITPVKGAKAASDVQPTVNFTGSSAKIKINFKEQHKPGNYAIWTCLRMETAPSHTLIDLNLPQGGKTLLTRGFNRSQEFYKSRYYGKNGRGKFRWDYPVDPDIPYPFQQLTTIKITKPFKSFSFSYGNPSKMIAEVAAVIVIPSPDREFTNEMVKVLKGVNNHQWYVRSENSK